MRPLPTAGVLKRSAKNAAFRARKKALVGGEAGFIANYNSLMDLAIPPYLMRRRDGDEFLLYDSGEGEDVSSYSGHRITSAHSSPQRSGGGRRGL